MMRPWHRKNQYLESHEDESDTESEELLDSENDLPSMIWSTLQKLKTPVAFAFSAVNPSLPNPGLHLLRHGVIGLPLSTDEAKKIISEASPSPFGRGEETIVDNSVRKCWELNPTQFSLENPAWDQALKVILDSVSKGLGISKGAEKISAELYKLLLYESGAFFKAHTDSEKGLGMFATLVVCLPSSHEGGRLVLTHDNEKYEFETALSSKFSTSYAAWYADIRHEVLPVTSGYRLMLVYNLMRPSDFVVPSYNLACERVQKLSTLLQQYDLQLESGDGTLPPFLLHRLKHKYTQANLKFNLLKSQDLNQALVLKQLSIELGFEMYLATLELTINGDDGCDSFEEIQRSQKLQNIVELDGNLVVKSLFCSDNALIDPTPQDEAGEADEEDHEGPTGNAGCPATYWYRDTTVILIPPSKQLDFAFHMESYGDVIEPLFSKLIEKYSQNPTQKQKLEHLCELALKRKGQYGRDLDYLRAIPPFFQKAAATALNAGLFELFDEACTKTTNKIMLLHDFPRILGCWAAKRGFVTMSDKLSRALSAASSIAEQINFLRSVTNGFEAGLQDPCSAEVANFKQWSDKALLSAISQITTLTKADGISLGQLPKTMDWKLYQSNLMPSIQRAAKVVKISFTNTFLSSCQHELIQEQKSFIEYIIQSIWEDFIFDFTQPGSVVNFPVNKEEINASDCNHIIENTSRILSPEYVEAVVIPAMTNAILTASKKCSHELFVELVRMILKNELAGFRFPTTDSEPPTSHKCFVQALLIKFLINDVGFEPQVQNSLSIPPRSCKCKDCSVVNNFLLNPTQKRLDFPCSKARRYHLHQNFTNCSNLCYNVVTIRSCDPNIWRITKNHQQCYKNARDVWLKKTVTTVQTLAVLENDEQVKGKLEMYLQPYYDVIMNAKIKELPNLKHLITTHGASNHGGPADNLRIDHIGQVGHKRSGTEIELQNCETIKRSREGALNI
ncbi:unnamed protein product [Bemisia tabaci]|uniref:Prolyl 4-hydroxylase alpha subunit Fe(2+) 2OG dioxygenase domain-containing protein n=1 Tax=Bemisia tabaci TaxID=7038 RepID=A0A9P0F3J1_BEMTA|nr:unnamed protein product [Bemisia tabaci]